MKYKRITQDSITESLVGKKVFRIEDFRDEDTIPPTGLVVSGNQQRGILWVVWAPMMDPRQHRTQELALLDEDGLLTKTMKFSGKTFGALEKFCEQVRVEGGDEDTKLNPDRMEHVAIKVELPLATKPYPGSVD